MEHIPELEFVKRNPQENAEQGEELIHSIDLVIDGHVIGKAEMEYLSKPFPHYAVKEVYVEYDQQGQGYGSAIMEQVESFLTSKRKAGVIVDAILREEAEGMYERRGWQPVPGQPSLYAYNLPASAQIEQLQGYPYRYRPLAERPGYKEAFKRAQSEKDV